MQNKQGYKYDNLIRLKSIKTLIIHVIKIILIKIIKSNVNKELQILRKTSPKNVPGEDVLFMWGKRTIGLIPYKSKTCASWFRPK